jgi:hypothetical protein
MESNQKPQPAYVAPAVVYEAALEVRAGSVLSLTDPLKLAEGE